MIDVGKKGDSTGDILTFHNDLYDASDTNKVGFDQGQCTRMSPAAGSWECWWSIVLEGGQITAEGPFSDTAPTATYAVTGGTGTYVNSAARCWKRTARERASTRSRTAWFRNEDRLVGVRRGCEPPSARTWEAR